MKSTKVMLMVGMLMVTVTLSGAALVTDDFETAHDYLVDGTAGTVWDGLYQGNAANAVADAVTTTAGKLTLKSSNGGWEWDNTGLLLYVNVTGDFTATVHITAPYVDYNTGALLARDGASVSGEDWIATQVLGNFDRGPSLRTTNDNNTETYSPDPATNLETGWARLVRQGDDFSSWFSTDGVTFSQIGATVTRADLAETLQVGLAQGAFAGNIGEVTFDDFSVVPEPATMALLGLGSLMAVRRKRVK